MSPDAERRPRAGLKIEGRLRWQKRTRAGLITGEGEQHNLITDAGLDLLATVALHEVTTFAAVGTSSTAPDVSDVSLGAQNGSRTSNTATIPSVLTRTGNGVYEYETTKEFDFGEANGNNTEWGFSATVSGDLWCRELFRDGGGNPVPVTKTSDEKLRLVYTISATITATTSQADVLNLTGVGPKDITWLVSRVGCFTLPGGVGTQADDTVADWSIINSFSRAAGGMALTHNTSVRGVTYADRNAAFTSALTVGDSSTVWSTYTPGSCERTVDGKWLTTAGNGTIIGYFMEYTRLDPSTGKTVATGPAGRGGWLARYDIGEELTKDDFRELTILGPVLTWARA